MGRTHEAIDERLAEFLGRQHVFFVATAPLSADGHVNVSPKGLDSFRILDGRTVAFLDLVGSGVETVAHLKENGRITLMFCAFEGPPQVVRLHGRGEVIEPGHAEFEALRSLFPDHPGVRSVVRVRCERVSGSCGFGVPLSRFEGHRSQLTDWAGRQGPEKLAEYQRRKNAVSIDGLPGVST